MKPITFKHKKTVNQASTLKIVAKEIAKVAAILIAVELFLQLVTPEYGKQIFDNLYTGGYKIGLNSAGYRGPLVSENKESKTRVLALGDSITFGTGIRAEDTWILQTGRLLQMSRGETVDVINASLPGARIKDLEHAYKNKWIKYQSDIVVVQVGNNMISLGYIKKFKKAQMPKNGFIDDSELAFIQKAKVEFKRFIHKFCLPSFLSRNTQRLSYWLGLADHKYNSSKPFGPMLAFGYQQGDASQKLARDAWQQLETDMSQLVNTVNSFKKQIVVLYVPPRFYISDSLRDNEKRVIMEKLLINPIDKLQEICKRLNVKFINPLPALVKSRQTFQGKENRYEPFYVDFDFTHLNRIGGRVVAEEVVSAIVEPRIK